MYGSRISKKRKGWGPNIYWDFLEDYYEGEVVMKTKLENKVMKDGQFGFSLLELLLVVGVGALLLLAGISTYRLVTSGNSVNDATRLLTTIKTETQRIYQGQAQYDGLDNVLLNNAGAFPSGVVSGAGAAAQPKHPWGGNITVGVTNAPANDQFIITFTGIPTEACIKLGQAFDASDTDFVGVNINGNGQTANPTPATVSNDCTTGGTTANVDWIFF